MASSLLVLAVALDSGTFLAMGTATELNPIVLALGTPLALVVRWAGVALLLALRPYLSRRWYLVGAWVAVVGAASNVLVLA